MVKARLAGAGAPKPPGGRVKYDTQGVGHSAVRLPWHGARPGRWAGLRRASAANQFGALSRPLALEFPGGLRSCLALRFGTPPRYRVLLPRAARVQAGPSGPVQRSKGGGLCPARRRARYVRYPCSRQARNRPTTECRSPSKRRGSDSAATASEARSPRLAFGPSIGRKRPGPSTLGG